jgi:hypothetical protein
MHGNNMQEHREFERKQVVNQVQEIYRDPPRLHQRFKQVSAIPLDCRLKSSTRTLKRWMHRLQHQMKVSNRLCTEIDLTQPTIHQAFKKIHEWQNLKYPP